MRAKNAPRTLGLFAPLANATWVSTIESAASARSPSKHGKWPSGAAGVGLLAALVAPLPSGGSLGPAWCDGVGSAKQGRVPDRARQLRAPRRRAAGRRRHRRVRAGSGRTSCASWSTTRERVRCLVHTRRRGAAARAASSPKVEVVVGDVRDPVAADRLFDGVDGATVFHAAAVIHPRERTREFFDVNVGGTELVLDRARRARTTPVRARVVELAVRREPDARRDRFTEDSPYNPYMGYGRSKLEAEQLVQRSHDRGDVATVIVRAPWFYGPFQPDRQTQWFAAVRRGPVPARRRRARSGARWCSPATSSHGLLLAETADRGAGPRVLDRRRRAVRAARDPRARCATRSRPRGSTVSERRSRRCRAIAGVVAAQLDGAAAEPGPLRAGAARARRAEGHDRLRHLAGPGRARLRPAGRACSRACGRACAGASSAGSRSDGAHDPRHRRQRLLRQRPRRAGARARRRGPDLRPQPAGRARAGRSSSSQGDVRDRAAVRAACDGVDVVLHNVAQVPLARDRELFWSVNVVGTANVLLAARDAGVGEGRAHVVERDLRDPGVATR